MELYYSRLRCALDRSQYRSGPVIGTPLCRRRPAIERGSITNGRNGLFRAWRGRRAERKELLAGQKKAQPARIALEVPPKEEVLEECADWRRRNYIIFLAAAKCKRFLLLCTIPVGIVE